MVMLPLAPPRSSWPILYVQDRGGYMVNNIRTPLKRICAAYIVNHFQYKGPDFRLGRLENAIDKLIQKAKCGQRMKQKLKNTTNELPRRACLQG